MVFGLFGKKQAPASPQAVPLPPSPALPAAELPPAKPAQQEQTQTQLRTPSPSVASVSVAHGPPQSPSPAARMARLSVEERARQSSPTRQATASMSAPLFEPTPSTPPLPTVESLTAHLKLIPIKTLHSYMLSYIPRAPETLLPALAEVFAELAPPPKLHCVRCHKDYVEVENDDRSCLVPHDDESAEVERVGRGAKNGRIAGDPGTTYETTWGCCGKVTEGDGDQGPPDGWCYEGKHTTDIKRARFRADSTAQDDKLTSCLRLNCHGIRDQLPRASLRKRRRSMNLKEPETEDDGSEGDLDSGMEEIVGKTSKAKKGKGKGKATRSEGGDSQAANDNEQEAESASKAGSVRGRTSGRGRAKAAASATKRRGRPSASELKTAPHDTSDRDDGDDAASASAPKRRGRKPKSKMYVDDSDADAEQDAPPTGSRSRTRPSTVSVVISKPKSRARKVKADGESDASVDRRGEDEDDDQPKKKRKTAA